MTPVIKHWVYDNHIPALLVIIVIAFAIWVGVPNLQNSDFLYSAIASILGVSYFIVKQKLEETRFFKELFSEFNARYNQMNDKLYAIINTPENHRLTDDEIRLLYDYFNLCAEEYLYYKMGYIYVDVWKSWFNGMKIFCGCPQIAELWKTELETNSYYNFPCPCSNKDQTGQPQTDGKFGSEH